MWSQPPTLQTERRTSCSLHKHDFATNFHYPHPASCPPRLFSVPPRLQWRSRCWVSGRAKTSAQCRQSKDLGRRGRRWDVTRTVRRHWTVEQTVAKTSPPAVTRSTWTCRHSYDNLSSSPTCLCNHVDNRIDVANVCDVYHKLLINAFVGFVNV